MASSKRRRSRPVHFFYLLQPVDQRITVHMELTCSLRDVQVILHKTVDRDGHLFIRSGRDLCSENL